MSRKLPRPNRQIVEEASTWFVAFRTGDVCAEERQDFHDWLKRSPEHVRAYLEIASVYSDIPEPESGRTPEALIARAISSPELNVHALNRCDKAGLGSKPSHSDVQHTQPVRRRPWASRMAAAASILLLACAGVWFHSQRNTYDTDVGEQRSITLADGSIIELNARSKVRVAFGDRQREVQLLQGQALFRVAKDHSRPFIVHAGSTSVRAVGTQFDVYRKSSGTIVTVLEGRVAVVSDASGRAAGAATDPIAQRLPGSASSTLQAERTVSPSTPVLRTEQRAEVLLVAGEQMSLTPGHARKIEQPNIAAATAWTERQLVFDGMPLAEVIEEFSRYTPQRFVIDSPQLAGLKISGQYTSTSPESLLRFLSLQEGVVVAEIDGQIHIRQQ